MKGFKLTCKIQKKDDHYSLKLPEDYKRSMHELMKYCFDKRGGFCSFSISTPKKPRSTGAKSQSHHFNGHVTQISRETGQPFESVKTYLKAEAVTRGYPALMEIDEQGREVGHLLDLRGNVQGISEADCTSEDCVHLIDQAHQFADEYNIKLREE